MLQVKSLQARRRRAFGLMAGVALSCTLLAACSDEQADSSAQAATSEPTSDIEAAESSGTDENETKKSETRSTARDSSIDGFNDGDSKPIPPNVVLDSMLVQAFRSLEIRLLPRAANREAVNPAVVMMHKRRFLSVSPS